MKSSNDNCMKNDTEQFAPDCKGSFTWAFRTGRPKRRNSMAAKSA